jgi:hypothetical protein
MTAIVLQHHKHLSHPPRQVRMKSIDSNGFTLEYRYVTELFINPSGEKKQVHVPFKPSITDASQVRSRLVSMSQEAEAGLPAKVSQTGDGESSSMHACSLQHSGFVQITSLSTPSSMPFPEIYQSGSQ